MAESCTGGLVGSMLTSVPGSSDYLLLDAVVYSNSAKTSVLGVGEETLRAYGAVSEETAISMVNGVLRMSTADLGVSITGIAGPGGGTDENPVGTAYVGLAHAGGCEVVKWGWIGTRYEIMSRTAKLALNMVRLQLSRIC